LVKGDSENEGDNSGSINDDDNEAMEEDLWDFEKDYEEEEVGV
jgi:hypothetical protein